MASNSKSATCFLRSKERALSLPLSLAEGSWLPYCDEAELLKVPLKPIRLLLLFWPSTQKPWQYLLHKTSGSMGTAVYKVNIRVIATAVPLGPDRAAGCCPLDTAPARASGAM